MSGLMACTGEADGEPMKIGVALSDIITGLNAAIGILAALNHRNQTGKAYVAQSTGENVTVLMDVERWLTVDYGKVGSSTA